MDLRNAGTPVNRTSTGDIKATVAAPGPAAAGHLMGFYVNSTTALTLVFRDGGAGGTVLNGAITPAVGWHEFPAQFANGLHVTFGGAGDATFFIK